MYNVLHQALTSDLGPFQSCLDGSDVKWKRQICIPVGGLLPMLFARRDRVMRLNDRRTDISIHAENRPALNLSWHQRSPHKSMTLLTRSHDLRPKVKVIAESWRLATIYRLLSNCDVWSKHCVRICISHFEFKRSLFALSGLLSLRFSRRRQPSFFNLTGGKVRRRHIGGRNAM